MDETSKAGEFKRTASVFRNWIRAAAPTDGSVHYPPEDGRYHLYVSYACPWASRCLAVRKLKGLEHVITVTVVDPVIKRTRPGVETDAHSGWHMVHADNVASEFPECGEDPVFGAKTLRDIYEQCNDTLGKFTVPLLVDKRTKSIVSNESSEIIRMFGKEFNAFAKHPSVDLYPDDLAAAVDAVNEWVYSGFNNGVYRAGFARSQAAYEEAVEDVFATLERLEALLAGSRFLVDQERLTEADVRLFVTLVRFDEVYHGHFKCNRKRLADYPQLLNYTRDVYQQPGIAETVNMKHIKHHYHRSHPTINPFGIVPVGPGVDYSEPHDRQRFAGKPVLGSFW